MYADDDYLCLVYIYISYDSIRLCSPFALCARLKLTTIFRPQKIVYWFCIKREKRPLQSNFILYQHQ